MLDGIRTAAFWSVTLLGMLAGGAAGYMLASYAGTWPTVAILGACSLALLVVWKRWYSKE